MPARLVRRRHEVGATATEYALMALLIAIVIIGGITAMGTSLNAFFSSAASLI